MKTTILKLLILTAFVAGAGDDTTWNITFKDHSTSFAPKVERMKVNKENTKIQGLKTTETSPVTVVRKLKGLGDKPLQIVNGDSDTPYTPNVTLVNKPNGIAREHVHIEWEAVITKFEKGEDWKGFENLLVLVLRGNQGQPLFTLGQLKNEKGGTFSASGVKGGMPRWKLGEAHKILVDLNLKKGTFTITIDDSVVAENVEHEKLKSQPIRIVEFRDGTALGGYDGKWTAGIDNIKIASKGDRVQQPRP